MSASDNEALVRRAIEAIWNCGDLDVADDLFAPDYVNHDGLITDLVLGPEAIKITVALCRLAFPDLDVIVEELAASGETVVLRWTAQRLPADEPEDCALTASNKMLTGTTRIRLADGKMVESWTEWDGVRTLHDLGLAPMA